MGLQLASGHGPVYEKDVAMGGNPIYAEVGVLRAGEVIGKALVPHFPLALR